MLFLTKKDNMKYNFSAGPSMLPQDVLKQAADAVLDLNGSGLSVLEISHRSQDFEGILEEATSLVRELLEIPRGYAVLFLQGGAASQFAQVPLNLLPQDGFAAYLDTGVWATKAIKEASRVGEVRIAASSSDKNYNYIPRGYEIPENASYFHLTSNNTIYGTQIFDFPKLSQPVVADMSSDIFSRKFAVEDFSLIYAGAQKNVGPAGMTLVIVREDILGKSERTLPAYLDFRSHIAAGSMFNTPPVFAIYVAMLNLRWLKEKGGVHVIEEENRVKSRTLYEEIDRNSLFSGTAHPDDRSLMNVTFVGRSPEVESAFAGFAQQRNLENLKGHRSVGGFRASIYNAMGISGINALVDAMQEFEENYK